MTETWRAVVGFEGLYEVSDLGNVRSLDRTVYALNRWGQMAPRRFPGRLLHAYRNLHRGGYRYVNLHDADGQHLCRVARLVAAAFIGPANGLQVCHCDGNSANDRAGNLRYGTAAENIADQLEHGTRGRGEKHSRAVLSAASVREIRRLHNTIPKAKLAERFGVSAGHINNIQCGARWAHE